MLIQTYNWKGRDWDSAIKVTGVKANASACEGCFDIELTINRYTDDTCQFDIEQVTKVFADVPPNTVDGISIIDLSVFEDLLLTDSDFQ